MDYFAYLRLIRESNLSTKARIVALIIGSYNPSFPTNQQIADGAGLCERTVRSAKAELVAAGYLRQDRTFNAANHYHITAPDADGAAGDYHLNTNINTNRNTKKIKKKNVSNETLILTTEVKAEESSAINNDISFDEIFTMFERTSNEERNHRPAPAGRSNQERGSGSRPSGRYDIDDAELSTFNQELARAREESW
jgi:hypothetical protein